MHSGPDDRLFRTSRFFAPFLRRAATSSKLVGMLSSLSPHSAGPQRENLAAGKQTMNFRDLPKSRRSYAAVTLNHGLLRGGTEVLSLMKHSWPAPSYAESRGSYAGVTLKLRVFGALWSTTIYMIAGGFETKGGQTMRGHHKPSLNKGLKLPSATRFLRKARRSWSRPCCHLGGTGTCCN